MLMAHENRRSRIRPPRSIVQGLVLLAVAQLMAGAAAAQFVQYTPPGTFQERRETVERVLERNIETARWRTGRVFWDPWAAVRDLGFVDPVAGSDESDLTATAGLGIRGWLPVGSELTIAGHLLPEYVWWQEFSERNRWNGRYGIGLFGDLGRTGLALHLTRVEDAEFFSREFEDRVNRREDRAQLDLEVEVGGGFAFFLGGEVRDLAYDDDPEQDLPTLSIIDRREAFGRAGVSYLLPHEIDIGIGVETSQAEFGQAPGDRSNSGTAPVLILHYEGSTLTAALDVAFRSLSPSAGSSFVEFEDPTGRFEVGWRALGRLQVQIFGGNDLVYSFSDLWAYYEDQSLGLGLQGAITSWLNARVFVETGDNDYTAFDPAGPNRLDDFDTWGLEARMRVDRFQVQIGWWETDYQSNVPGFDRSVSYLRSGVSFGLGSGLAWE